jgi:hypothetical protein
MRDQIIATKKDLYSQIDQLYLNRQNLKEGYNELVVRSRQVKNEIEEKNKALQELVNKQSEDIVLLCKKQLSFVPELERYKKDQEVLSRTNEITSDGEGYTIRRKKSYYPQKITRCLEKRISYKSTNQ